MPVLLLLMFLLLPVSLHAEPDLFSFATSLAAEGDHYRAITEYKRFIHYHPDDPRAAQAQLAIAEALLVGERWEKLDRALKKIWQTYPDSSQAQQARKLYADAAYRQHNYDEAKQRYETLKQSEPATQKQTDYQIGVIYLEQDQPDKAEQSFDQLPTVDQQQLQPYLNEYRQLPRKSPSVAGTLSALLPGAGQLYTKRPKQAVMAFALNAAFIYGAVEAWDNENYAVAGIVSLFEVGWYGGNIYNAMNNAHKYNRTQQDRLREMMRENFNLSLGLRNNSPFLQAKFKF